MLLNEDFDETLATSKIKFCDANKVLDEESTFYMVDNVSDYCSNSPSSGSPSSSFSPSTFSTCSSLNDEDQPDDIYSLMDDCFNSTPARMLNLLEPPVNPSFESGTLFHEQPMLKQDLFSLPRIFSPPEISKRKRARVESSPHVVNDQQPLRSVSSSSSLISESNLPRSRTSSSPFRGVSRCTKDGRWQARIRIQKEVVYLGRFQTEELAARRYDEAARLNHGVQAVLNFITPEDVLHGRKSVFGAAATATAAMDHEK